jgi:hypothetical protein
MVTGGSNKEVRMDIVKSDQTAVVFNLRDQLFNTSTIQNYVALDIQVSSGTR